MRIGLLSFIALYFCLNLHASTLQVGKGQKFATISSAVEQCNNKDTILVSEGIYLEGEPILITKPLSLISEKKHAAIIDAGGKHGLIVIRSDSVTVKGFCLKNVGTSYVEDRAAILIENSMNCLVSENKLLDAFFGIYLKKSSHCEIHENIVEGKAVNEFSSANAIHLWYCKNIIVDGNHLSGHRDGIYLEFVDNSQIINNLSENNVRYGLHFMFSNNDMYSKNTFRNNGAGVAVMFSHYIDMHDNIFEENRGATSYGLLLKEIYDGTISRNLFSNNSIGLYAEGANRLKIEYNQFRNNGWALRILGSSLDNVFSHNNFYGNSFNLSTNARTNHNTYQFNYWDDYTGYDLNKDGIGDVPFRPVGVFSYLVTKIDAAMILLRSPLIEILNFAERVAPALTPTDLTDNSPAMRPNL